MLSGDAAAASDIPPEPCTQRVDSSRLRIPRFSGISHAPKVPVLCPSKWQIVISRQIYAFCFEGGPHLSKTNSFPRIHNAGSWICFPGPWIQDPGSWIQDPFSRIQRSWIQDPGSWMRDSGSRILDPAPRAQDRIRNPGSWMQDPVSTILDPLSMFQDLGGFGVTYAFRGFMSHERCRARLSSICTALAVLHCSCPSMLLLSCCATFVPQCCPCPSMLITFP